MAEEAIGGVTLEQAFKNAKKAGSISAIQDGGGSELAEIGNNSGFYFTYGGSRSSIEKNGATLKLTYPTAIPEALKLAIMGA